MSTIFRRQVLLTCIFIFIRYTNGDGCVLTNDSGDNQKILKRLDNLKGKRYYISSTDASTKKSRQFDVAICGSADGKNAAAGAVEITTDKGKSTTTVLGNYKNATIHGGSNWIFLTYEGGKTFNLACNNVSRSAGIMIVCNPNLISETITVLEAFDNTVGGKCAYMFNLETSKTCMKEKEEHSMSGGSVFCIIFFTFALGYVLLGFLYQRFVVGAKGYEQIPNLAFWQHFCELQADGCDFICRWGSRRNHNEYKGIDSNLGQSTSVLDDDDSSDHDEHLLPV